MEMKSLDTQTRGLTCLPLTPPHSTVAPPPPVTNRVYHILSHCSRLLLGVSVYFTLKLESKRDGDTTVCKIYVVCYLVCLWLIF